MNKTFPQSSNRNAKRKNRTDKRKNNLRLVFSIKKMKIKSMNNLNKLVKIKQIVNAKISL